MSKADEIELSYIHIPTFYNAKFGTENKTNTVQETKEFSEEENSFGYFGIAMLLIIILGCILSFIQKRSNL